MAANNTAYDYALNLHMEAIFRSIEDQSNYLYSFVTFDKNGLEGPYIEKIKEYNVYARAVVPITKNEKFDMALFTGKDDSILDFHMTYLRVFTNQEDTLFGRKFPRELGAINIRSDIGPKSPPHPPHIDIQIFDRNGKLMAGKKVDQNRPFSNYECVISAVLMQIEKISNPLIGTQYWLSPIEIHPDRVILVDQLRKEAKIDTPLCAVARAINFMLYEETARGIVIDDQKFREIVLSQIQFLKEQEKIQGGGLDIQQIPYSTDVSILPFLFFKPDGAEWGVQAYSLEGKKMGCSIKALGVAQERKREQNITRDLSINEANYGRT